MGYGDIGVATKTEFAIAIILMFIGVISYSNILTELLELISSKIALQDRAQAKILLLKEVSTELKIPNSVNREMKRMLEGTSKIKDEDNGLEFYFRNVNPNDVEELLYEAFNPKFKDIQLFNERTKPLMIEFAKKMKKTKVPPNTIIYEKGDHSERFYVIASGSVKLMFHDSEDISFAKIVKGYFGEFELFRDGERRYTIMTDEEETVLFSIKKEHFMELFVNRDRDFCNEFKEFAFAREIKFRESLAELQTFT